MFSGFPSIFVAIWAVFRAFGMGDETANMNPCIWMGESSLDWIVQAPAAVCLLINLIFLFRIMFVSS
jgi:hypothetical protein